MATARVCVVVEAPVERLWPPLADFGNWIRWLPLVEGVELEGDGPAVEWSGDFDADAADEVAVRPRIENLYRAFIDALAAHANA